MKSKEPKKKKVTTNDLALMLTKGFEAMHKRLERFEFRMNGGFDSVKRIIDNMICKADLQRLEERVTQLMEKVQLSVR